MNQSMSYQISRGQGRPELPEGRWGMEGIFVAMFLSCSTDGYKNWRPINIYCKRKQGSLADAKVQSGARQHCVYEGP